MTRFFRRVRIKFGKYLANSFPHNKIRCLGLKLCGFKIGKEVYIGSNLTIASIISDKGCELVIDDRVAIGPNVTLVLSSDANNSVINEIKQPVVGKIHLQSDCWLGAGVIILPNITIGQKAIIAAGSVVTKSVGAEDIVAGVPAKFLKKVRD